FGFVGSLVVMTRNLPNLVEMGKWVATVVKEVVRVCIAGVRVLGVGGRGSVVRGLRQQQGTHMLRLKTSALLQLLGEIMLKHFRLVGKRLDEVGDVGFNQPVVAFIGLA